MTNFKRRNLSEVIFGSPMRNCAGHGICKILTPGVAHTACQHCRRALAYIQFHEKRGQLSFSFIRESFSTPKAVSQFQGRQHFTQESRLFCHAGLLGSPLTPSFFLLPGKYAITEDEYFFYVRVAVDIDKIYHSDISPHPLKRRMIMFSPSLRLNHD
ncbi:MAG: hypothetical protein H6573_31850 [Lewinellaceae bacterium]|nr:hypothetical protein [Lewinellaceae bacterium]